MQQGVYSEFDESSDNFVDCVFVVCAVCAVCAFDAG